MASFLLYGPPGSGKTTMACTIPGKKILIDIDNKAEEVAHIRNNPEVTIIPIKHKLTEDNMKVALLYKVISKQPQGFLQLCDIMSELEKKMPEGTEAVIIDSMTKLCEHLKRIVLYFNNISTLRIQDWGTILSNLENFVSILLSLPVTHKILISHDMLEKDEVTGDVSYRPLVEGQMRFKLGQSFNEIYYMAPVLAKDKRPEYRVLTVNDGKRVARTSFPLDVYEPSDLAHILKKGGLVKSTMKGGEKQ